MTEFRLGLCVTLVLHDVDTEEDTNDVFVSDEEVECDGDGLSDIVPEALDVIVR